MPLKAKQDRRRRIPKQRHRVANRAAHDAGLRARGSLTILFTIEAVEKLRVLLARKVNHRARSARPSRFRCCG